MSKRLVTLAVMLLVTAGLSAGAQAKRGMQVGLYDSAQVFANPDKAFAGFKKVRTQVARVDLAWGGRFGVAKRKPKNASDPNDAAYNWSLYDPIVAAANKYKIKILFSIVTTPRWNGGGNRGNLAPKNYKLLKGFARAAAARYSGTFKPKGSTKALGSVRLWLAWNEPNNPIFLYPQYRKIRGRFVAVSPTTYAKICTSIYAGVHATKIAQEQVACGATGPRGNNAPRTPRPSVDPLSFVRALKKAGVKRLDAYAHHPYGVGRTLTPFSKPKRYDKNTVMLGNINDLIKQVTRQWGKKPIWITEYGWQTNPPDRYFGVTWRRQARFLSQSFAIARKNPRISLMIWFLIRDERRLAGWQSGFYTANGRKKPAYDAFRRLPH
ncbi:MAG: glycosyl hydrolase [Actinomycetota bacterium]|nr:glycosyl hydrolase [Actinomycetota bacterium]